MNTIHGEYQLRTPCFGIGVPSPGILSEQRSPSPHAISGTDRPHCCHQILDNIIEYTGSTILKPQSVTPFSRAKNS